MVTGGCMQIQGSQTRDVAFIAAVHTRVENQGLFAVRPSWWSGLELPGGAKNTKRNNGFA